MVNVSGLVKLYHVFWYVLFNCWYTMVKGLVKLSRDFWYLLFDSWYTMVKGLVKCPVISGVYDLKAGKLW